MGEKKEILEVLTRIAEGLEGLGRTIKEESKKDGKANNTGFEEQSDAGKREGTGFCKTFNVDEVLEKLDTESITKEEKIKVAYWESLKEEGQQEKERYRKEVGQERKNRKNQEGKNTTKGKNTGEGQQGHGGECTRLENQEYDGASTLEEKLKEYEAGRCAKGKNEAYLADMLAGKRRNKKEKENKGSKKSFGFELVEDEEEDEETFSYEDETTEEDLEEELEAILKEAAEGLMLGMVEGFAGAKGFVEELNKEKIDTTVKNIAHESKEIIKSIPSFLEVIMTEVIAEGERYKREKEKNEKEEKNITIDVIKIVSEIGRVRGTGVSEEHVIERVLREDNEYISKEVVKEIVDALLGTKK